MGLEYERGSASVLRERASEVARRKSNGVAGCWAFGLSPRRSRAVTAWTLNARDSMGSEAILLWLRCAPVRASEASELTAGECWLIAGESGARR